MHCQVIRGSWSRSQDTAVGCSNYGSYHLNPAYALRIAAPEAPLSLASSSKRSVRITARLQCGENVGSSVVPLPATNLSLFEMSPSSSDTSLNLNISSNPKKALFSSNEAVYTNRPTGACIQDAFIDLSGPDRIFALVPSTFDPTEFTFTIYLYSTVALLVNKIR